MSAIRESLVALDTNQILFAVRRDGAYPYCQTLISDRISELRIFVPMEVQVEMRRNLTDTEARGILEALRRARSILFDYAVVPRPSIAVWEERGAKKGDAVIAAALERAGVEYFISENRHFLREIARIPFKVISSAEAIHLLT